MSSFHNNALVGASGLGGYQIERSLRLDSASSAYLHRTPSVASNQKKYTISLWVKRCGLLSSALDVSFLGAGDGTTWGISGVGAFGGAYNGKMMIRNGGANVGYWDIEFRDPSAWYHFVLAIDTDQATPANRNRLYVNGVEQPAPTGSLGLGATTNINSTFIHSIGTFNLQAGPTAFAGYYTNALITEYHFVDGSQLTPSTFGENDLVTGVWKPKKVTGVTYGTNGFYLKFADNSNTTSTTLGKDSSGNGNNWSPVGFSVSPGSGNDSLIDTPTPYADGGNGRGNYCTWNPLAVNPGACTFANGNLDVTTAGVGGNAFGTFAIPASGKWYWEVVCTTGNNPLIGIAAYSSSTTYGFQNTNAVGYYLNGQKYVDAVASAYGSSYTTQIIGVAADADAGTITFYRDNVSQGSITHAVAGLFPTVSDGASATTDTFVANFGQRPFAYTPPSGFKALNTQNLPEPSIKKSNQYFDVNTWTGTSASNPRTNSGSMQPDLLWVKNRNGTNWPVLFDSARGVSKYLRSDSTGGDVTDAQYLTSFDSGGFTLGADLGGLTNYSGLTYVGWQWKESATPGFDIVTWTAQATAATVAHSLGVAPKFIIFKSRDNAAYPWFIYHSDVGIQKYLQFSTAGSTTNSTVFSTAPTSTVFDPGTGLITGNGYNAMVAYLWSEVAGFSKFGSYTGNGVADGPFVFCNFRPRWVLIKSSTVATSWYLFDAVRGTINVNSTVLYPDTAAIEDSNGGQGLDFTSNGFKVRSVSGYGLNNSGASYIFAAFAESPFKYALAR